MNGGNRNREIWEDQLLYLKELDRLMRREREDAKASLIPLVIAGNVNQREQPEPNGPRKARRAWADVLAAADLRVVTDESMIDRIAVSRNLTSSDPAIFPPEKMSDHHAVSCQLGLVS